MSRAVDKLPTLPVRPMQVIGLGASRTGTLGLTQALKVLGYRPFHISELIPHGIQQMKALQEAIVASKSDELSEIRPFGREEFDKMWGEYDCIIESPCYLGTNAIKVYLQDPNVKFILTERSPESFAKSISGSLGAYNVKLGRFPLSLAKYFDSFIWELAGLFNLMTLRWSKGISPDDPLFMKTLEKSYIDYMTSIKALVPSERLLILNLEKGFGWDEVCTFLGREVPETPYPRSNSMSEFHVAAEMIVSPAVEKAMGILTVSGVAILSIAIWYWRIR